MSVLTKLTSLFIVGCLFISFYPSVHSIDAQAPAVEEYDKGIYFGKEYGSAGILDTLIDLVNSGLLPSELNQNLIIQISRSMHALWNNRVLFNGSKLPTWQKELDLTLDPTAAKSIYPGQKYGPAGILSTLLKMYELTQDNLWLNRVIDGYWLLASQALNSSTQPHWPYAYTLPRDTAGIAITDLKYGSAGILDLNLELYRVTKNRTYLDHAGELVDWLQSVSVPISVGDRTYNIIPWYYIDNANLPYYTGYYTGISGISPLLYVYANYTNDVEVKDWSISLIEFLSKTQFNNGSWYTDDDTRAIISSLNQGVAGTLLGMYEIQGLTDTDQFDPSIYNGIAWLFSQIIENDTYHGFYGSLVQNKMLNSLYRGNLGILHVLTHLQDYLSDTQKQELISIYKWFYTQNNFLIEWNHQELNLMFYMPYHYDFVDLSYAEGVTGVLANLVMLQTGDQFGSNLNVNLTRLVNATLTSILFFQRSDYLWQRQVDFDRNWFNYLLTDIIITSSEETKIRPFFNIYNIGLIGLLTILVGYIYIKRHTNTE